MEVQDVFELIFLYLLKDVPADVFFQTKVGSLKVIEDDIQDFYPSLYLNVGKSYEDLGNWEEARRYYQLGANKTYLLPDTELGKVTSKGIANGIERISAIINAAI